MLLLVAPAAHAELYRWIDPQTGSVKLSSVPPPASQQGVEIVPYRGQPSAKPAASEPAALEARWRELLGEIARGPVANPPSPALQKRIEEFAAASARLDRLDPGGTARRRAEAEKALQRFLRSGP